MAILYAAPPYLVAIGALLLSSFVADKMKMRLPLIIFQATVAITGLACQSHHSFARRQPCSLKTQ